MRLSEPCEHISVRREDFRISFSEPFSLVFLVTLLISEVMFLCSDNDSYQVLLIILPAVVTVLCTLAVAFVWLSFKFEVSPEGVDCYDFWGRKHCAHWSEISSARVINMCGLQYLKVTITGKSPMWLPLFVRRYALLVELIETYSPLPIDD